MRVFIAICRLLRYYVTCNTIVVCKGTQTGYFVQNGITGLFISAFCQGDTFENKSRSGTPVCRRWREKSWQVCFCKWADLHVYAYIYVRREGLLYLVCMRTVPVYFQGVDHGCVSNSVDVTLVCVLLRTRACLFYICAGIVGVEHRAMTITVPCP